MNHEKRMERKQRRKARKETIKQLPLQKKILYYLAMTILFLAIVIFFLASVGSVAHAAGLVDDTVNTANEYSKYGLSNYQLDFYVDNSWGWLPWNWSDGLGKSVMYGLYAITNFIWTISLYLSNATGYLVQEAYRLDFISQTTDSIGRNIQTIAGVTQNGFSTSGFYVGFLLLLILIVGIYVAYTGLIKRETTKAIRAVLNFFVVFILSASFIAYAPDYIGKINEFSKDVSNASLEVGTKIVLPNSDSQGKDSVDMIRDSLFSVQVKQPWLLLQYGTTEVDEARIEKLLSVSPDTNNGEDREAVVIDEIEKQENANLSISKVISRLGTVFFLFLFNIGISIFVFLLTGIMIFSQVLFIIFAMFLPVSFLLSMIPTFDGMARKAITKLFNVIMTRAGITLIITVAFSISTMLYSLSASSPFFMIMFLQIVTFAGIYFKLGDLMNMFALQSGDSQNIGRQILRRPRMFMNRHTRRLQRSMNKAFTRSSASGGDSQKQSALKQPKAQHDRKNQTANTTAEKKTLGNRIGTKVGSALDTKEQMADKASELKDNIKDTPTNVKYALHKGKRGLVKNASDFSTAIRDTRAKDQEERTQTRQQKRAGIAQKRLEMEQARQRKVAVEPTISTQRRSTDEEQTKTARYPSSTTLEPSTTKEHQQRPPTLTTKSIQPTSRERKTGNTSRASNRTVKKTKGTRTKS